MKVSALAMSLWWGFLACASQAFAPVGLPKTATATSQQLAMAKYNSMEEILALFPDDKPVLINFYDAATENAIKDDIFRAKQLLQDRATLVSIKQQDYPDLARLVRSLASIFLNVTC